MNNFGEGNFTLIISTNHYLRATYIGRRQNFRDDPVCLLLIFHDYYFEIFNSIAVFQSVVLSSKEMTNEIMFVQLVENPY